MILQKLTEENLEALVFRRTPVGQRHRVCACMDGLSSFLKPLE